MTTLKISDDDLRSFLECIGLDSPTQYVFAQCDHCDRQYYKYLYDWNDSDRKKYDENENNEFRYVSAKKMRCDLKSIGGCPSRNIENSNGEINDDHLSNELIYSANELEKLQKDNTTTINYYGHDEYDECIYLYKYEIIALKKISDERYLYAIKRSNDETHEVNKVDVCYQLKFYDRGMVTISWILSSYNPYAGCSVSALDYDQENNMAMISYCSKGGANARIKSAEIGNHNIFHVGERVGEVVEFVHL